MKTAKTARDERSLSLNSLSFFELASIKCRETEEAETPKAEAVSMTVSLYLLPDIPRRARARSSSEKAPRCFRVS